MSRGKEMVITHHGQEAMTCSQRDVLSSRFYQLGLHFNYIIGSCAVQFFFSIFKQTSEQHSVNSSCKTSLFSDAFRVTVVDFFREFY